MCLRPTICIFLLLLCTAAQADVYIYVADDGTTHLSDVPSDPRYRLLLKEPIETAVASAAPAANAPADNPRYDSEINAAAQDSRVEAALLKAVIAVESNYNPRALSAKGAQGLMQLMPATARAYGVRDPWNARQNIRGGARHLRALLDRFADNKTLALAAYNAGEAAVLAHGMQVPPFAETRSYVPAVLQRYAQNQMALTDRQ